MRSTVRYIVSKTWQPLLSRYLSQARSYAWKDIRLEIAAGVFHPRFFFSTRLLLHYISKKQLRGKNVLELGAGSGLLSIFAAKQKANVLATDISTAALACLDRNRQANGASFDILRSNLFDAIPPLCYHFILINPPYYKKDPLTEQEYAWYCGAEGEYFQKLFGQLGAFMDEGTETLMTLCDGCDLEGIRKLAGRHHFRMRCVRSANKIIENNYIFKIERCDDLS